MLGNVGGGRLAGQQGGDVVADGRLVVGQQRDDLNIIINIFYIFISHTII